MKPTEVPAEYVQMMADAEFDAPPGCSAADSYRTVLAAVIPEIERRVREQVAAGIYTAARKWASNAQASSTAPERERRFAVAAALTKAATGVERGERTWLESLADNSRRAYETKRGESR